MRVRDRARRPRRDDGFTLIEMMVSVAIITVVMSALTALYVRSVDASSSLRAKQSAILVTTQALDGARSIGASAAVSGRGASDVAAQFTSFAGTPVAGWLDTMDPATDSSTGGAAQLPTSPTQQTIGSTTYAVNYLVGTCHRKYTYSEAAQDCTNDAPLPGFEYLRFVRVVVAVSWQNPTCAQGTCYHAGAVLLNDDFDPLFNTNVEPAPPVLSDCADPRELFIGEQLEYDPEPATNTGIRIFGKAQPDETQPLCNLQGGVPPFQWSAPKLPAGLEIDEHGYIVGTVAGPAGQTTDTLTVTDVYQKSADGNPVTWTVTDPAPSITSPGDQRTRAGEPFSLALDYTCPLKGCTFTLDGVPEPEAPDEEPGDDDATEAPEPLDMAISAKGVIYGTAPGAPETITGLTVTITAANGKSATTTPFSWAFTDGPLLDPIADQEGDAGHAADLVAPGTCGEHGPCTYSVSGAPWPTIDSGGHIRGNPAAGTWSITVTLTDADGDFDSVTFTWMIYDETRIVPVLDQQWTKDKAIDAVTVTVQCGRAPCEFKPATGLPGGITFDKTTGVLSGTPTTSGSGTAGLSAKDGTGNTVSATFDWTVKPKAETFKNTSNDRCLSASGSSVSLDSSCTGNARKWYRYDDKTIRPFGNEAQCLTAPTNNNQVPTLTSCNISNSAQKWTVNSSESRITVSGSTRYLARADGSGSNSKAVVTTSSSRADWKIS